MSRYVKPATLQIDQHIGTSLGLAILCTLLMLGIIEGFFRILDKISLISPPYIGTYNAELDIKIRMLDELVDEYRNVDCIFLGSSQFDNAADPEIFMATYHELSNESITCFNFSLQTLTASPAGAIAKILIKRYHPGSIIYGTSARDYSSDFGEAARPLLEDAWVDDYLGNFNIKGWLMERSYVVRLPVSLFRRLSPEYHDHFDRLTASLTTYGFAPVEDNDLSNPKKNFIPEYNLSAEDMAGLDELTGLSAGETQIIIVEVPVHHSFIPYYIEANEEAYHSEFIIPVSEFVKSRGVPFWETQEQMQRLIPDAGWNDIKHLNTTGATLYSRWLAQRVFEAVTNGEIDDPFLP